MECATSHLYILRMHTSLEVSTNTEKMQMASGIFHGIARERHPFLYHAIDNTVTSSISATYMRRMVRRLDVTPSRIQRLSCNFYDMYSPQI